MMYDNEQEQKSQFKSNQLSRISPSLLEYEKRNRE